MRAVIIGGGAIKDYDFIKSKIKNDDFIICADGGSIHAKDMGIEPDIIIGDFDSCSAADFAAEKIQYPARKDFTDGELCVKYASERGFDEILMLAVTGDRMDHTITDIFLLTQCKNGCIIDDNNEIYLLRDTLELEHRMGKTLSIIPIGGDLCGITTKNLEYPLNDETLFFGESRGNSNVIAGDKCAVSVKSGMGLVIINDGK